MFATASPESLGLSSRRILDFVQWMDSERFRTHGILFSRGDTIAAEGYYAPFHADFHHRMYSVSKSFVAVAVGMAVTEGLLSLDDVVVDYFPEFRNEKTDAFHDECTIRDMLCMSSNIGHAFAWWGKYQSRVGAYYDQTTDKIPGTLFDYDSIGSFLLGCIIEKLTGKTFLDYLKEKVLLDIGFSKESYTLTEPGGFTIGDSGVMCTTRDLWLFARLIMKKGEWNGKQYIDRQFMEDAVRVHSCNDLGGQADHATTRGYGYLIWKTHPDGFSLIGAGDQLAICDTKRDLCFVITSDNQADTEVRRLIYHEFYRHFLPTVADSPLPAEEEDAAALKKYLADARLVCQYGEKTSPLATKIHGVRYLCRENPINLAWFRLDLQHKVLEMEKDGRYLRLEFDLLDNKFTRFSLGDRAVADKMGFRCEGTYDCACSAGWVREREFHIFCQVIDTYFGGLYLSIGFKEDRATFLMRNSGQYVFQNASGFAIGVQEKEN